MEWKTTEGERTSIFRFQIFGSCNVIGQFKGRQKTNVYGWVSDLAVARSGFNQIEEAAKKEGFKKMVDDNCELL